MTDLKDYIVYRVKVRGVQRPSGNTLIPLSKPAAELSPEQIENEKRIWLLQQPLGSITKELIIVVHHHNLKSMIGTITAKCFEDTELCALGCIESMERLNSYFVPEE